MGLLSAIRYRGFVLRYSRGQLRPGRLLNLSLHHPVRARFSLREVGSDPSLFQELFVTEVYREVSDHVQDCRTIVDLGANIGLASLYFADQYPSARIVALEPFPDNYLMLQHNLKQLIRQGRAKTVQAAISHSEGEIRMGMPEGSEFSQAAISRGGAVPVQGITMEKLIAQQSLEQIDLLKVDIEGSEIDLFQGPSEWLARVRAIAIEFHGGSREESGFDALMRRHGFRMHSSNAHTVLATR